MDGLKGYIQKELYKNFCEGYREGALNTLHALRHTFTQEEYEAYVENTENAVKKLRKGGE